MRVLFTSLPGIGHMFPMVPLAWALQASGHTVLVATDREFLPVVNGAGLPAAVVLNPFDPVALFKPVARPGRPVNPAEGTGHRCAEAGIRALPAIRALIDAWHPTLVIAEPMELAGPAAATIAGLPWVRHSYGLMPPERLLNAAVTALNTELAVLGLPSLGKPARTIGLCPDSLQPADAVATTPMRYVPYNGPASVPDWLLAGPPARPRVCVTLGTSLPRRDPQVAPLWRLLLDELVAQDKEVIIAIDERHRPQLGHLPDGVRAERIPLCELMPTCTAIVHHGGSGSTMTAVAFGVPQLIIPHFGDQFANAEQVTAAGAGISLPNDTDDLARISAACALITEDGPHRANSGRLADENARRPRPTEVAEDLAALVRAHGHFATATQPTGELRGMDSGRTEFEHVITRLEVMLNDVWDQRPAGAETSATAPLVNLGVDSLTLALLLDKVGREFHIDWTADVRPDGAISLRSIADLVLRWDGSAAAAAEA